MAFRIEVEPQAFKDLDVMVAHVRKAAGCEIAHLWLRSILSAVLSLKETPGGCAIAPESAELGQEVRLLLHGGEKRAYRIYFAIHYRTPRSGTVRILHVMRTYSTTIG